MTDTAQPYSCSSCHGHKDLSVCPLMTGDHRTLVCRACVMVWFDGGKPTRCAGDCGSEHVSRTRVWGGSMMKPSTEILPPGFRDDDDPGCG